MNRFPVIIDCDPGVDDAVAILLAKQLPELDVRAITAVAGNVEVEKTYANAHKILHVAKWDVPVFMGAAKPLIGAQITAAGIHGVDGLGGLDVPGTVIPPAPQEAAWDAIYREAVAAKGELVLIAVGPLTNLAIAFGKYRALPELIKRIVIMGGAATLGNTTPAAEFNIYADPEAASVVFRSGVPIVMMGLDLTNQTICTPDIITRMEALGNRAGKLFGDIMRFTMETQRIHNGLEAGPVHDVTCVAYLIAPEIFTVRGMYTEVDIEHGPSYGRTVCDFIGNTGRQPNALVGITLDLPKFWDLIAETLAKYE